MPNVLCGSSYNYVKNITWPFWMILNFIKRLLWSYFGEFARAKKEGASTGEHGGFDYGDSGG